MRRRPGGGWRWLKLALLKQFRLILKPPANVKERQEEGTRLRKKDEPTDEDGGGRISQYLQHCTEKRIDAKNWPVAEMMNEIDPLLIWLEQQLGPSQSKKPIAPRFLLGAASASTITTTHTAVSAVFVDGLDMLSLRKPK
jgi:hypothetical protein